MMDSLIRDTVAMIAHYDVNAARVFRDRPFNRIAIAKAFAKGFSAPCDAASVALRVAVHDAKRRALGAG
jgi:hypothetical protein